MPRLPKNIVKRSNGRFYFRMEHQGRCYYRSLGTRLDEAKRQAQMLKQDILGDLRGGESIHQPVTVDMFGSRWLSEYISQRRNEKGVLLATQRFQDYVSTVVGKLTLPEVRTPHIRAVGGFCKEVGLSSQTVRHVLSDLKCLLRYGAECGLLSSVPSFRTMMPAVPERAPKSLSEKEVEAILQSLNCRQSFVVRLALLTGLRWGEIRTLHWRHVIWRPKPHLVLEITKSKKVRRVPLLPEAAKLLQDEFWQTRSVTVSPYRMKNPCSIYAGGKRKCGVSWHFHQLRHTFACRWLELGGSKEALQKILGHSTIRLTERYGALSDEAVFSEAETVASRVSGRVTPVDGSGKNLLSSSAP